MVARKTLFILALSIIVIIGILEHCDRISIEQVTISFYKKIRHLDLFYLWKRPKLVIEKTANGSTKISLYNTSPKKLKELLDLFEEIDIVFA